MRKWIVIAFAAFILTGSVLAQWQKVNNTDLGLSGKIFTYKNIIFHLGSSNGFKINRSTDNGSTWTSIAAQFPYDVYFILSRANEIMAVTKQSSGTAYLFYVSTDDGVTWAERSRIAAVTGNGAIISLVEEGGNLYAVSNRRSTYKSTDGGLTWPVEILHGSTGKNQTGFAALNNVYVVTLLGAGSLVSTDAGATWATVNAGGLFVTGASTVNGTVYGLTSGDGIYTLNSAGNAWAAKKNGLPSPLTFQMAKFVLPLQNIAVLGLHDFMTGTLTVYKSSDAGSQWVTIPNTGLPLINAAVTGTWVAALGNTLYLYNNDGAKPQNNGIYSSSPITAIEDKKEIAGRKFQLEQNYPNPFNPSTRITYTVAEKSYVQLRVFDVLGNIVSELVNEEKGAGNFTVNFSAHGLSSGIYFYQLKAGGAIQTKKLEVLK
ncbi:MAG: T9SS type A sorting domain-containing protein [Ignavibacteriales bacterium]|nr:T9SS type A sorting domain-containing protein [Ignavibacteriales bacterium]